MTCDAMINIGHWPVIFHGPVILPWAPLKSWFPTFHTVQHVSFVLEVRFRRATLSCNSSFQRPKNVKLSVAQDVDQPILSILDAYKTSYNAVTPNNCFVKGSHKYDIYLWKIKHISTPQRPYCYFGLTQCDVASKWRQSNVLWNQLTPLLWSIT